MLSIVSILLRTWLRHCKLLTLHRATEITWLIYSFGKNQFSFKAGVLQPFRVKDPFKYLKLFIDLSHNLNVHMHLAIRMIENVIQS